MGGRLTKTVQSQWLADQLGLKHLGVVRPIALIKPYSHATELSLSYSGASGVDTDKKDITALATSELELPNSTKIETTNPRLSFARATQLLQSNPGFIQYLEPPTIDNSAQISESAQIGNGVSIGANTHIGHNVVIGDGVSIGRDCVIKSNSVIGEDGFGFERDESGIPIRIPHLGSVSLGDRVEIGSISTICRGTIEDTVIGDDVKIDDHVHIAHNCEIRSGTLIAACAEISGGVLVGNKCWIAPNSSIKQKVVIGDLAFVGIASNVTKDVSSRHVVGGNPARILSKL